LLTSHRVSLERILTLEEQGVQQHRRKMLLLHLASACVMNEPRYYDPQDEGETLDSIGLFCRLLVS
jgi:hypothetical protein